MWLLQAEQKIQRAERKCLGVEVKLDATKRELETSETELFNAQVKMTRFEQVKVHLARFCCARLLPCRFAARPVESDARFLCAIPQGWVVPVVDAAPHQTRALANPLSFIGALFSFNMWMPDNASSLGCDPLPPLFVAMDAPPSS